ncbi:MAG: hypothetical protein V1911_02800 [Candidatus Micrarchaeota archaeon]
MRLYFETSILIDYIESKGAKSKVVLDLIMRALRCEFEIVISDFTILEAIKKEQPSKFEMMFEVIKAKNKLVMVLKNAEDFEKAKRLEKQYGIHWHDILHCLLAKKAGADYVVTRDRHFWALRGLLQPNLPEDF